MQDQAISLNVPTHLDPVVQRLATPYLRPTGALGSLGKSGVRGSQGRHAASAPAYRILFSSVGSCFLRSGWDKGGKGFPVTYTVQCS